ncbi:hypothetical protein [Ancylobacter terrae]|uniref:hypothetical protein n=1 Tax=Ancylobacter sp. sgz301288 TaxID=3342077 RepID=UPI0038592607
MTRILVAGMTLLMLSVTLAEARKSQSMATSFTPAQQEQFSQCMAQAKAKAGTGANRSVLMQQAEVSCKAKVHG